MTFEMGRNDSRRNQYYSAFLENCMLACASRMSTSPGIRALGPKYAEEASAQVTQELQRPNVATLQGFLLLSDFEATRGRERIGYIYSGIGCRMDLRLRQAVVVVSRATKLDTYLLSNERSATDRRARMGNPSDINRLGWTLRGHIRSYGGTE